MNDRLHPLVTQHVASTRFEAARHIPGKQQGHRCSRLHGHGFIATAYACLPESWAEYQGGEVSLLRGKMDACAGSLDYRLLNETLADPTDENLAYWFQKHLDVPTVDRIAIQSTPDQGVYINQNQTCVWRRYRFQAAHQLPHVPEGHKCGRLHGHGFQVILHALGQSTEGQLKIDYETLDASWAPILEQINYRCLNHLPGLENPTSEMIASWIWHKLKTTLPTLTAVTVYETASCGATFDGLDYRIWKDFTLDSAVRYQNAPVADPLYGVHGYTYTVRLHLQAPLDQLMCWTVDYGDVKAIFNPVFKSLDHHPLHEQPELINGDTATIAHWLHCTTQNLLPQLFRVDLFETPGCGALVGANLEGPAVPV